jgi:UDP-N-acetyl-D-mannosaminuronic acid dehydrogenase
VGVGGHCISVDPWFFVEAAPDQAQLIRQARQINDQQPAYVAERIGAIAGELTGKVIAFLGLSFKPNVDDLRESPAVKLARMFQSRGAQVIAYEPYKLTADLAGVKQVSHLDEALIDADVIILAVAHQQFIDLDPQVIRSKTQATIVYDAVCAWDKSRWEAAGFKFFGLARKY